MTIQRSGTVNTIGIEFDELSDDIISLAIGMVGAIYTYKFYLKARTLKTISWTDVHNGTWSGYEKKCFHSYDGCA